MGNDTDGFVILVEAFEGRNRDFEGVRVEAAEAFVDEEGINPHGAAREVREAEGEGKACEEAFPAGEAGQGFEEGRIGGEVGEFDLVVCFLDEKGGLDLGEVVGGEDAVGLRAFEGDPVAAGAGEVP